MTMEQIRPLPQLPPGFRFHPTDEELLIHYLKKKISSSPQPVSIIADVDLYKFDPWDLPGLARFGEQEWYFFSPRERKYPNGDRPNRAAASGYWKATGIDKPVMISGSSHKVGVKKGLVFYKGRPPKGVKTSWIMHEYRLTDPIRAGAAAAAPGRKGSMRLDDWVLCRIYKRGSSHVARTEAGKGDQEEEDIKPLQELPRQEDEDEEYKFLHSFLREDDMSDDSEVLGADDLTTQLVSTKLKRKVSLVFDDDIDNLNPAQTRHKNNSSSGSQYFNPGYEDPTLSEFHQIYSLISSENTPWSSEIGTAWLS